MTTNESVMNRYAEAYSKARTITTFGFSIKLVGGLIGIIGAGGEAIWKSGFDGSFPLPLFMFSTTPNAVALVVTDSASRRR